MNWNEVDGKLVKEFTFANFVEALKFVNAVGERAEAAKHHPDIHLYSYKHVRIELSTHDAGGVTEKDHQLAQQIDQCG